MATLSVVKFETPDGAAQALATIQDLQKQNLIQLLDAATVAGLLAPRNPRPNSYPIWRARVHWAVPSGACCSG